MDAATIWVDRIDVHTSGTADSGFLKLFDDEANPIEMDLLDLTNGVTQELVRANVPAGTYRQVRLYFSDAELEIGANHYAVDDGRTGPLRLTSQAASGLKVFIRPPAADTNRAAEAAEAHQAGEDP